MGENILIAVSSYFLRVMLLRSVPSVMKAKQLLCRPGMGAVIKTGDLHFKRRFEWGCDVFVSSCYDNVRLSSCPMF